MGKRAAIYLRISQDRLREEEGVERQAEDCQKLAQDRGLEVVEVYSDNDISASTYSRKVRPAYRRLLQDIEADRIDCVVSYHTKRLYRKPEDLEGLITLAERHRVKFFTVKSGDLDLNTATGKMVARIMAGVGAAESDEIHERVERQRVQQAAKGKRQGGGRRHFGYNFDMTLRPDEAKAIEETARKLLAGASLYRCAQDLNTAGLRTPDSKKKPGGPWRVGNLRRLMMRPTLAGIREHRSTIRRDATGKVIGGGKLLGTYPAEWPAILTEDQHRLLVSRLATNGNGNGVRLGARKYLLAGLLRCSFCNSILVGSGGRYVCDRGRSAGCGRARVDARAMERMVLDRVGGLYGLSEAAQRDEEASRVEDELLGELRELEERLDALADNIELDERQLARRSKALREKRDQLQRELQATAPAAPIPTREELEAEWARWAAYEHATAKAIDASVPEDDIPTIELTDDDIARMREHVQAFVREVSVKITSTSPKAFDRKLVTIKAAA